MRFLSLEERVRRLERLIYERSVGRGGGPSKAYILWDYLSQNGPKTATELQATDLRPDVTSNAALRFFLSNNLIIKNGNNYFANLDYHWDDVGVLPRTAAQELQQEIQNAQVIEDDPEAEIPVRGRRERTARAPREPHVREIKQNLFSRKYDEVKAAIDAGQDCTAANDKGITPLMFACRDPKGQSGSIVEMLLEHGANANDLDGNKHVIYNALKNNNFDAVKSLVNHGADLKVLFKKMLPIEYALEVCEINDRSMETICLLTNNSLSGYSKVFNAAIKALSDRNLNKEWYNELINRTYNGPDVVYFISNNERVADELQNGVCALYDLYVKLTGKMPLITSYRMRGLMYSNNSKFASDKLYSSIKDVVAGKIKPHSISNLFMVYMSLDRPIDGISDFMTPEYVIERSKTFDGRSDLMYVIQYALINKDVKPLQAIAKSKISVLDGNEIITYICERTSNDRNMTASSLRIANNCKNIKNGIDRHSAYLIAHSDNEYLIDWAIDKGFGQQLVDVQAPRSPLSPPTQLSSQCKKALLDAGFSLDKITSKADRDAADEYKYMKNYILRMISNDEWNRSAEEYIRKYPKMLTDTDILDEIKDNPDSVTGRQLKRRIDALPKEDDKYDF